MNEPFVAAAVQLCAGLDKAANLATATRLVTDAAGRGARFVCLPELFNCFGPLEKVVAQAEPIPGPTSIALSRLAQHLGIFLLGGSICQQSEHAQRGYNTSLLYSPEGRLAAAYHKIHLFDVDVPADRDAPAVCVQESRHFDGGSDIVVAATTLARVGLSICYDLRFPELYGRLAQHGAEVIAVAAAFTYTTGRDHWETLLKARAIENQAYVIAANQCGRHGESKRSYGHSCIIDPWGQVLSAAGEDDEAVILAEINPQRIAAVRRQLPALAHRRIAPHTAED